MPKIDERIEKLLLDIRSEAVLSRDYSRFDDLIDRIGEVYREAIEAEDSSSLN